VLLKSYRYRIYPSNAQQTALERWLALCCELYNAALQERRDAYRIAHQCISYRDQQNQLPEIKTLRPELGMVHSILAPNSTADGAAKSHQMSFVAGSRFSFYRQGGLFSKGFHAKDNGTAFAQGFSCDQ